MNTNYYMLEKMAPDMERERIGEAKYEMMARMAESGRDRRMGEPRSARRWTEALWAMAASLNFVGSNRRAEV